MFIEKQLEKNGKKSYNKDKEMKRFQKEKLRILVVYWYLFVNKL